MSINAIDTSRPFPFDEEKANRVYQAACWLCATHARPDRLGALPGWNQWLKNYAAFKATHKDLRTHTVDQLIADPDDGGEETPEQRRARAQHSKRLWSAVWRWSRGAAVDINALDRLYIQLRIPLSHRDFPPDALLRRRNYPWHLTADDYAVRVALVVAEEEMRAALEGRPPVWAEDEVDELLTTQPHVTRAGGDRCGRQCCPCCGADVGPAPEPGRGGSDLRGGVDRARPVRASERDADWWYRDD